MSSYPSGTHSGLVPHCRLFILGGRNLTDRQWKDCFDQFGTIEHVVSHKDRRTGEPKGVCYITYTKASEAFLAQESMDQQCVPGCSKPIKVNIASDKRDGNVRDENEGKFYKCICVKVPTGTPDEQVRDEFSQYGELEYANVMKPRNPRKADTLAFIKYKRAYCAAVALESCDESYKGMFADNKEKKRVREWDIAISPLGPPGPPDLPPHDFMIGYGAGKQETCLEVMTTVLPEYIIPDALFNRLFDLIPGMDFCEVDPRTGIALVRYVTADAAAYAKEKLSGFEYPPGQKLGVRFAPQKRQIMPEIEPIARKIRHAKSVLAAVGLNEDPNATQFVPYTEIPLPLTRILAPKNAECHERLFIVCSPKAISEDILTDAFCRFGNLIDVYMIGERNFGYANYADKESAQRAVDVLHGHRILNSQMKVVIAEKRADGYGNPEADVEEERRTKRMREEGM